ncbi:HEAT repeat domain-containing protein [Pseudidiomarina sp. 1APP75-27a]|uniref:HEAT repeat domain-containing protein n=1 Tax=Pseudidiomarina terrestris TaxID=2820060 RepID=UPI002B060BEC|nr:HEAT repeat domain-containing protein [Pseudidiomarina sp. 1APP75-27a]MEA3588427.1 HEAT repeat domain-containing protein [Pseudidiomarina sp. 1APP75-27a]
MNKNNDIEMFLASPEIRERTTKNIELSRRNNLKLDIVRRLTDLFNENPLPEPLAVGKILEENSEQAIDLIVSDTIKFQKNDHFYVYPIGGVSTSFAQRIVVSNTDYFDLSIDVIDAALLNRYKAQSKANLSQRGILFYGRQTLTYFISAGGLKVSSWQHQVGETNFEDQSCERVRMDEVNDGDLRFNSCSQTMMYEQAETNVISITLEYKANKHPFSLMFSAEDFKLKFQNPSDELDSRVQLSMLLLKKLNSPAALPVMKKFISHKKHFLRWYAIQQILGIDALQVIDELQEMSDRDPHPEVRCAAQKVLKLIEQKELSHAC